MTNILFMLIPLIAQVETGNKNLIGDNGLAAGHFQIHKCVVDDLNRIYDGKHFEYYHRCIRWKARAMCYLYLSHYGRQYTLKTGKPATMEVLSRIWNGGPKGYKKKSTVAYWEKLKVFLK